ncbi:MAG: transcription-repair coupling factor [Oscillospiraceae bacterium]
MQTKFLNHAFFNNPEAAALPEPSESGGFPALITGLSAVHRAHFIAALMTKTEAPVLVVAPDETAADALAADLRSLTGAEPNLLTSREYTFYSADAASREGEQKRIGSLKRLGDGVPVTIVTASGLLQRALPPDFLRRTAFKIESGAALAPEDAEDALLRCGYLPANQVEGPGQFSRRGGILDFFSPAYRFPVRVEFWGDDIDSMGFFDIESQRRTETLDSCEVLPAAETLPSLYRGGAGALAEKLFSLAERASKRKGSDVAEKLAVSLREDAERLHGGAELPAADRYANLIYDGFFSALDYIPQNSTIVLDQPGRVSERAKAYAKQLGDDVSMLARSGRIAARAEDYFIPFDAAIKRLCALPFYMADAFTVGRYPAEPRTIVGITAKQLPSYGGSAEQAAEDVRRYLDLGNRVLVLAGDMRRADILRDLFRSKGMAADSAEKPDALPEPGRCLVTQGSLSAGMEYPRMHLAVLTDTQIAGAGYKRSARKKKAAGERIGSCADLSVGDLVVHEHHGIGRFAGVVRMPIDGAEKDYIKICYAGADTLYVPATQLDMVSKYIGGGEDKPVRLSKMGGAEWDRAKSRAKAAAKQLAKGLIALYAARLREKGFAFSPDSEWQHEFEERFGYDETDDQLRCIEEIKRDMESPVPMDRLLCGDVGYGKTEVALRAVMKCVLDGRQAALLCPTTVLAQQHYQTALQRFFGYPVNIEVMSRFRSPAEMRETLANIKSGKCDFVIGTHRLLQKDVEFKNLGLLIVDEEQRFGVSHKEHIKEMSRGVDALALSATPIPRTLNMALSGIRDMSTLEEPPQDRLPVQTFVMEHDWSVVTDAIRRELSRGGQVYYLHNRVENIERTAMRLSEMLGGVSVAVAHGKLDEEQLSRVMEDMAEGKTQVLVCTTIIETGIDIPNVNTLIIEDADKLGLAQLHQIRGRVGRSSRRASAYLTFKKDKVLTEIAEKRLEAIREFAEFNSGFRIAMRDLEIRGAGNLLGAEQSGHMIDVGYDMYLKLLEEAVLEEKGLPSPRRAECSADLAVSANIPESYVASPEQRMDLYRRIALIRKEEDADDVLDELIDRFGDPPPAVNALVQVALLRGEAGKAGIRDIVQKNGFLRFTLEDFDMARVSELYAKPEFKGRVKVEAGSKPCLSLRLPAKARVIEEARKFTNTWTSTIPESVVQ